MITRSRHSSSRGSWRPGTGTHDHLHRTTVPEVKFEKWQALGNDYLIVETEQLPVPLSAERIRLTCDRHFGLGGDGVILIGATEVPGSVASLRIFNPDGSEAELSGNGVREAVMYLRRSGFVTVDTFTVETAAGPITPTLLPDGSCSVAMGAASTKSADFPGGSEDGIGSLTAGGREWRFRYVSVGNPQCAIEVGGELEDLDLGSIGPEIENSAQFPNRTNVSFYRVSGGRVRARIFERGVGETLSSGTGAIGAAVSAHLGGAPSDLVVELDGGELAVGIGPEMQITLTGWAEPVFSGEASPEFLAQLAETPG